MKFVTLMINPGSAVMTFLFIALFCCGCTEFPKISKGTEISYDIPPIEYYLWAKSLPYSENQKEIQKLKARRSIDPVIQKIQLALLLSLPEKATPENEDFALTTLNNALKLNDKPYSTANKDYLQFASLWRDVLSHRLRQKNITDDLQKRGFGLEEENRKLLRKIEALKSIEQQINRREINQDIKE